MSGLPCFEGDREHLEVRFALIGLVASADFQQCLAIIEYLHKKMPHRFPTPFIRPMLEFDWMEYHLRAQRKYGGKLWVTEYPFIVFANNEQLVSAMSLQEYLSNWFQLKMVKDFECLALRGVADIYEKYIELGRKFVFFSITVNDTYIGTFIIMLYHDIVPKTCKNFMRKCNSKKHGYLNTRVHRIMNTSWIQFADFVLPIDSMSNENYVVPHNRRGVVSMCSNRPHLADKTQFFITLDATPWMDYRYVAFGQIMQGEYVLRQLENLQTTYDYPIDNIRVSNCGELDLGDTAMAKHVPRILEYLDERSLTGAADVVDVRDAPSILLQENYRGLKYCYIDDYCSYLPINNIASNLISEPVMFSYAQAYPGEGEEEANEPSWFYSHDRSYHDRMKEVVEPPEASYLKTIDTSTNVISENFNIEKYVAEDLNKRAKSNGLSMGGEENDLPAKQTRSSGTSKVSFAIPVEKSQSGKLKNDTEAEGQEVEVQEEPIQEEPKSSQASVRTNAA